MTRASQVRAAAAADPSQLLGRCERIVQMALARKADQAECYWEWGADLSLELENGKVASTGTSRSQGGSVRVVQGGRPGFAYLTSESDAEQAIERALANSRAMPAKGYSLPAGDRVTGGAGAWDDAVAALDDAFAAQLATQMLQGAREGCPEGNVSGGGVGLSASAWALASSEGAAVQDRSTLLSAGCSVVLADGERSVSASESRETRQARLDAHEVGRVAGATTQSLRNPSKVAKGGRPPILLEPEVAHELLVSLALDAAHGDEAMRGKTVWSNHLGASVAAPTFTLVDDATLTTGLSAAPADGEGLAARRIPILEGGILRSFLFDSWDGHQHGQPSSHSAVRSGFKSRPDTGTLNVVLDGPKPKRLDAMVAGIDDGYLVDAVLGAHTANATTGEFSVTAPNVWRIRKGAVEGPVRELAIAGRLEGLAKSVEAVSDQAKNGDGWKVPHVLVGGLSVSV